MSNELMTLSEFKNQFSGIILREMFKLIDEEENKYGKEFGDSVKLTILASYICNIVHETLVKNALEMNTENEKVDKFQKYRQLVQDSIALGFQSAMTKFVHKEVDYMCSILPVPDPVNKEPC